MSLLSLKNFGLGFGAISLVAGGVEFFDGWVVIKPKTYGVSSFLGDTSIKTNEKGKTTGLMEQGPHPKFPFFETIYIFPNNTQTAEFSVGDTQNTSDRNSITVDLRIMYEIDPKAGTLPFHLSELQDNDGHAGQDLLKSIADKSFQTVMGPRTSLDTLDNPAEVIEKFNADFRKRLADNNVAIKIHSIEIRQLHADIAKPLQIRIDENGIVQKQLGTAAVEVAGTPKSRTEIVDQPPAPTATQRVAPGPVPAAPVAK